MRRSHGSGAAGAGDKDVFGAASPNCDERQQFVVSDGCSLHTGEHGRLHGVTDGFGGSRTHPPPPGPPSIISSPIQSSSNTWVSSRSRYSWSFSKSCCRSVAASWSRMRSDCSGVEAELSLGLWLGRRG